MNIDAFTVLSCVFEDGVPSQYVCSNDKGFIKTISAESMKKVLYWRPGSIRNLTLQQISPPYVLFPTEYNGNLSGTVVCTGLRGEKKYFRVIGKLNGEWYIDDINEEEAAVRIKKGSIVNAFVRNKTNVNCKAPFNKEIFIDDTITNEVSSTVSVGKHVNTILHYITEASDEHGNKMRYAGVEYVGDANELNEKLKDINEKSLNFRNEYHKVFGRTDDSLALQSIPGKVFVVLPYAVVQKRLETAKGRPVKISRVIVSALAFRGGCVFDESRIVLSGVLGSGEVRGASGYLDTAVKTLAAEVQATFKKHVYLRTKQTN